MHEYETRTDERGALTRRTVLARMGVGAGVAWTAPMVLASPAGAQAVSNPPEICPPGFVNKLLNVKIQPEAATGDELLVSGTSGGTAYYVVTNSEAPGGKGQCVGNNEDLASDPTPRATRVELEAFAAALAVDADGSGDEFESITVYLPEDCDIAGLIAYKKIGNKDVDPDGCLPAESGEIREADRSVRFVKASGRGQGISHVEIVVTCCVEGLSAP